MTPLEAHVNRRMQGDIRRRLDWDRRSYRLPPALGGFIRSKLWKYPYRHMRRFPADVEFECAEDGGWSISQTGGAGVRTHPLGSWIGPIVRPVTLVLGGPSARDYPVEAAQAAGRLLVAVNGVPTFLAERGLGADAWIVSDPNMAFQIEANFEHTAGVPLALTSRAAAELLSRCPEEMATRRMCVIERVNQWHGIRSLKRRELEEMNRQSGSPFVFPEGEDGKSRIGWSHAPELGFFSGCTVAFAALQIVIGLGARDIDIVGLDLGGTGHVYQEEKGALPSRLGIQYEDYILPCFSLMHDALAAKGVAIRNHSPVCPLPARIFSFGSQDASSGKQ